MKSICKFELKSEYEDYQNEVDILAHVIEENKVYLRLGRQFSFCIHGYFNVPSKKDVRVLGINVDLANFASIKFTNLDTGEVKRESSSINKIVNLEAGSWRIDYGIYKQDSGYVTPAAMFSGWISNDNKADIPELTYIQVDPIVTKVDRSFVRECSNLTGAMFGELDVYPETEVFDTPYSHNDVIVNSYVSFVDNSSINFLQGCSKIGNVYIADGVSGFNGCFGMNDMWGETYDNNPVPTQVYLGKSVKAPVLPTTFMGFLNQNKITKYIVNPENTEIEYDSTVQALVLKGTHTIIAGLGLYKDGMLTIPSGYTIRGYREYEGRGPIIVDMSEYDQHTTLQGIRDLLSAELLILPKNLTEIDMYRAGFPKVETLIVPTKVAPICKWGDGIGNRTNAYDYAFSTKSNISGYGLGGRADKTKRKLYVIEGTAEEKATWTNKYDNWSNPPANTWQNGTTGNWERPNLWYDLTLSYDEGDFKSLWNAASGPYQEFEIVFVPENEMDALIQTKIQEKLTEIQNRNN